MLDLRVQRGEAVEDIDERAVEHDRTIDGAAGVGVGGGEHQGAATIQLENAGGARAVGDEADESGGSGNEDAVREAVIDPDGGIALQGYRMGNSVGVGCALKQLQGRART